MEALAGFGRQGEPVFLKEDSAAREQLRQLEALHAQADEKLRGRLEQDMRLVKAGIAGEEQILFELRSSHLPLFVLHDLFLRDGELSAQIDFAVVTPKLTFFLECKNLFGNIEIGADGSFVRTLRVEGQPVREGIYSPVTQNERHLELLKALRAKSMGPIKRALFLKSFAEIEKMQQTKNLDYYHYPSRYYVKPFCIAGNVYYIGDSKVCSHLIDTGEGLIMFDSGFQHSIHLLVQAIWEAGFNPRDIKYLIHSHEHFDHIGAANDFKDYIWL